MSLNSLSRLLNHLEQKYAQSTDFQKHRHLLRCWKEIVSLQTAQNSRPLFLRKGVLTVTTSSAVWAQTLSLQRYQLQKKLSPLLEEPIVDMRFSTLKWMHSQSAPQADAQPTDLLAKKSGDQCPKCKALTPTFELERWGICACCISQIWSKKSQ
jgi:predicted nucleic acid-binding Zn ribbon protein